MNRAGGCYLSLSLLFGCYRVKHLPRSMVLSSWKRQQKLHRMWRRPSLSWRWRCTPRSRRTRLMSQMRYTDWDVMCVTSHWFFVLVAHCGSIFWQSEAGCFECLSKSHFHSRRAIPVPSCLGDIEVGMELVLSTWDLLLGIPCNECIALCAITLQFSKWGSSSVVKWGSTVLHALLVPLQAHGIKVGHPE